MKTISTTAILFAIHTLGCGSLPADPPESAAESRIATASGQTLSVGHPVTLRFTSGPGNEKGRQLVDVEIKPGKYRLKLAQAGGRYNDQWILWDCLALKGGKENLWHIGNDDVGRTPPDYSERAFSEFSAKERSSATTHFVVGKTPVSNFCRELNDYDRRSATVEFELPEKAAQQSLTLLLSTLYSTHTGASSFEMNVQIERVN